MVLVAVAGGSSPTLGKSIVTAILATGKHDVIILSRKPETDDPSLPAHKYGAPIKYVSYNSIDSLTTALQGVHTLLSCLKIVDPTAMESYHLNLLRASLSIGTVQRFALSDFSLGPITHKTVDLLAHKSSLLKACQGLAAEHGNNIEVAQFQNGMFMQYLAQNLPDPEGQSADGRGTRKEVLLCGLEDDLMLEYVDIASGRLAITTTNSGSPAKVSMTSIEDVGKFVAAALDLPKGQWHGFLGMTTATVTFAQIRDILRDESNAPDIQEKILMKKDCESLERGFDEDLKTGFSVEALMGKMVAQMEKAACGGVVGESVIEGRLNELCLEVKVTDLRQWLKEVCGRKRDMQVIRSGTLIINARYSICKSLLPSHNVCSVVALRTHATESTDHNLNNVG